MFQDFSILTVRIALLAVRTGGRAGLMTRSIGRVTQMLTGFLHLPVFRSQNMFAGSHVRMNDRDYCL